MSFTIKQTASAKVRRIICPKCGERVPRLGLLENSEVKGLTFKCNKCKDLWEVESTKNK